MYSREDVDVTALRSGLARTHMDVVPCINQHPHERQVPAVGSDGDRAPRELFFVSPPPRPAGRMYSPPRSNRANKGN